MIDLVSNETRAGRPIVRELAELTLGVCGNAVALRDGVWHTHHSFGRIVELLAHRVRDVRYYAPQALGKTGVTCDYPLAAPNVVVCPWAGWRNSLTALRRPDRLIRNYWKMSRACDALFIRGSGPLIWTAHWMGRVQGKQTLHWVIGDPVALMRAQPRGYGRWLDRLGFVYAWLEQRLLKASLRLTGGHVLANGAELARIFGSPRTVQVISTSITAADLTDRVDTCHGSEIRLLFVGFIRPEKGLEYIVRALPLDESGHPVRLAVVGSWEQFPAEHRRLTALAVALGIDHRIEWQGYASFGKELFSRMDESDILVLPSLSEGTPRVLVEARARGLPVVSTRVGGIPSSVTDGEDGLLVPPRDSTALAKAVTRLIADGVLRRKLIAQGRSRVADWTVDRFVDLVIGMLGRR